jgi:pyruvate dehydrogenase E1 component
VVAASDYVRAVPDLIRPFIGKPYTVLGTDGFGRSDTRAALRAFFEVDARHVALAALAALDPKLLQEALRRYGVDHVPRPPWER